MALTEDDLETLTGLIFGEMVAFNTNIDIIQLLKDTVITPSNSSVTKKFSKDVCKEMGIPMIPRIHHFSCWTICSGFHVYFRSATIVMSHPSYPPVNLSDGTSCSTCLAVWRNHKGGFEGVAQKEVGFSPR